MTQFGGKGREIRSLTGLRGVAALLVVFFHYHSISTSMNNPTKWGGPFLHQIVEHGYLAVDLFFVLSGYVMALSHARDFTDGFSWVAMRRFLLKRLGRIYPLYLVMTLVCFLLACDGIDEQVHNFAHNAAKLLVNTLLLQSVGGGSSLDEPAWSISTEMVAYCAFPIGCALLLFRKPRTAWLAAAACFAVVLLLAYIPETWSTGGRVARRAWLDLADTYRPFPVMRCLAEFGMGMVTWRVSRTSLGARIAESSWLGAAALAAAVLLLGTPNADVAFVALLPVLVLSLSADRSPAASMLGHSTFYMLGVLSYSIYLVHYPIYSAIFHSAWGETLTHTASLWLGITASFAISAATYCLIEKPGRNYSRALLERSAAQPSWAGFSQGRNDASLG